MNYKGFTIEPIDGGPKGMMQWYDTAAGIDCEFTGDGWSSNVRTASSIDDAVDQINEEIERQFFEDVTKKK